MAITFTNARQLTTDSTSVPWNNQPARQHGVPVPLRAGRAARTRTVLNTNYFISRWAGRSTSTRTRPSPAGVVAHRSIAAIRIGSLRSTASSRSTWARVPRRHDLGPGQARSSGSTASPPPFGTTATGQHQGAARSRPTSGSRVRPGHAFIYTLHDFAIWDGYELAIGRRRRPARRHAAARPTSARPRRWRGRWTMHGDDRARPSRSATPASPTPTATPPTTSSTSPGPARPSTPRTWSWRNRPRDRRPEVEPSGKTIRPRSTR